MKTNFLPTSTDARNFILDNRSMFPELSDLDEMAITKILMTENCEMRVTFGTHNVSKFSMQKFLFVVFSLVSFALILWVCVQPSVEMVAAVAGIQ